jgi:hypothetical protein
MLEIDPMEALSPLYQFLFGARVQADLRPLQNAKPIILKSIECILVGRLLKSLYRLSPISPNQKNRTQQVIAETVIWLYLETLLQGPFCFIPFLLLKKEKNQIDPCLNVGGVDGQTLPELAPGFFEAAFERVKEAEFVAELAIARISSHVLFYGPDHGIDFDRGIGRLHDLASSFLLDSLSSSVVSAAPKRRIHSGLIRLPRSATPESTVFFEIVESEENIFGSRDFSKPFLQSHQSPNDNLMIPLSIEILHSHANAKLPRKKDHPSGDAELDLLQNDLCSCQLTANLIQNREITSKHGAALRVKEPLFLCGLLALT